MAKLSNATVILAIAFAAGGCSSKYEPRETILDEQNAQNAKPFYAPKTVLEKRAYEEGVSQVLLDMKGKMRARNRFTYEAPHVECGLQMPARIVNGMLMPSHETCVQIAPGRYTEEAPTFLPELGQ